MMGFLEARVVEARTREEPHGGFWPARSFIGSARRSTGRAGGLSSEQATAVGVSRSTLGRWRKNPRQEPPASPQAPAPGPASRCRAAAPGPIRCGQHQAHANPARARLRGLRGEGRLHLKRADRPWRRAAPPRSARSPPARPEESARTPSANPPACPFNKPPPSPKLNRASNDANPHGDTSCYACRDLPPELAKIALHVEAFEHLYNYHRPHRALAGATRANTLRPAGLTTPTD